jgi:phosphoglycolate phosphatase
MAETSRGTIVFDLDGTLVDSAPDLADALDKLLVQRGHASLGLATVRGMIGNGVAELVRQGLATRGEILSAEALAQAVQRFLMLYTANLSSKSTVYPGTEGALAHLRQAGWRLAVCTNKLEASARGLLSDLGLLQAFALVAGPDTFGVAKPDPRHLQLCLNAIARPGQPALFVGDSEIDLATARAAGIPVIAVTWGYARVPLEDLGPDLLIRDMGELADAVDTIANRPSGEAEA